MPKLPSNHLSEEGLQEYAAGRALPAEARSHLELCSSCLERAGALRSQQQKIDALRGAEIPPTDSACPEPTAWWSVIRGLLPQHEVANLLAHASGCGPCAQRLRDTTEDLETEPDLRDPLVRSLPSSLPRGMYEQARKLTQGTPAPRGRPSLWVAWRWAAAAILIAAVSGAIILAMRPTPVRTNGLLAKAYEERRSSELRFPNARYVPIRQERGEAPMPAQSLLEAEAVISKELNRHPEDARWLQASGRAKIIGGMFDGAIAVLTHAAAVLPEDASVLADLGAAYFVRGQARDEPADYRSSLDFLSKAIERNPRLAELRFNRAVILEHLSLYDRAASEWDQFLRLEPAGGWADEARARQAEIKMKLAH